VPSDLFWLLRSVFSDLNDNKKIIEFEKAFAAANKRSDCVAFPFARTGLYYVLKNLPLKPGDKILMPPITIKAMLDVVLELKLEPIFIDLNDKNLVFDLGKLKKIVETNKPKVALLTYLFGIAPDLTEMVEIFKKNEIYIIEDFSQNFNGSSNGIQFGTIGDVSIYSTSSLKTVDTYGGGMVLTDDLTVGNHLRNNANLLKKPSRRNLVSKILTSLYKNILSSKLLFNLFIFPIIKFSFLLNKESFTRFVGNRGNSPIKTLPDSWFERYTSVQASVGLEMLKTFENRDNARIKVGSKLEDLIEFHSDRPINAKNSVGVYWQFIIYVKDYHEAKKVFLKHRVDTGLTSLVLLSKLKNYQINFDTPNAEKLYSQGVYLPCYKSLSQRELHKISIAVKELLN
jgi:perosamine synthetase